MQKLLLSIFSFICLGLLLSTACNPVKSEREKMYLEVMKIHDDVMPEMSTIHRLKKQLKAIDTSLVKSPNYPTILNHLSALEKADEGMMGWMAEFSNPTPETEEADALKYLENEKIRISAVRDQMRESITSAKGILLELKTTSSTDSKSKK